MTPSSGLVNLLERLTDRNICLCLPVGYREYYNGPDKQPDEEVHRLRSGIILE